MSASTIKRGAFIVFEGCDRSGKSTQSHLLYNYICKNYGTAARLFEFPNRKTTIGQTLNAYLKGGENLSDEAVHLLFTANRWEFQKNIKKLLLNGVTVIADRYLYSGIAYSVAKGLPYDWCLAHERGLICPDLVFYLKINSFDMLLSRGNFGEERYEKMELQSKVSKVFDQIYNSEQQYWQKMNGEDTVEEVHKQISTITKQLLDNVCNKGLKYL